MRAALTKLQAIYRPGFPCAKAGVMLMYLRPADLCRHGVPLDEKESLAPAIGKRSANYVFPQSV